RCYRDWSSDVCSSDLKAYERDGAVEGTIVSKVKGGLKVDIGVAAFLPGSHADLRPTRNLDRYIGQRGRFAILKFNRSRGNVVVRSEERRVGKEWRSGC